MPLIGTICCQDKQPTPFNVCQERCMGGECKHSLPIIMNMARNTDKRQDVGISASVLGGCPRQYLLGRDTNYYEDPEDYYARWLGSVGHHAIEMDGPYPGIIQETRFYREIDTPQGLVEISGQPDWIDTRLGIIADHKMVARRPPAPRQEHIQQLNVYRWLTRGSWSIGAGSHSWPTYGPLHIKKLEIRYYHPESNGRHTEYEAPIWEDADVEHYIRKCLVPILHVDNGGSVNDVGLYGGDQGWRYNYCPWRHPCNPGTCCMAPVESLFP